MPIRDTEWMGINGFTWFVGIVESRFDPLKIGRVQVRCFGWHTQDKTKLPTNALPWAQVLMPAVSASTSGIGNSPTGLTEGSWVVGFFMDGRRGQTPMILGSFHGVPGDDGSSNLGFNDPFGVYPLDSGQPDTSPFAAGGDAYNETQITKERIDNRLTNIPTAKINKTSSVSYDQDDSVYETPSWNQPELHSITKPPLYPFNHVRTTESGHTFEIDDTVGARRIHEYHASGTNREIMDDGTRVTRIVGDDYEICLKDKNVVIYGSCNVTVVGDARIRVDGDMVQEVLGNYNLSVKGDMKVKIEGNQETEVLGSSVTQINTNDYRSAGGDRFRGVGGAVTESYGSTHDYTAIGNTTKIVNGTMFVMSTGKMTQIAGADIDIGSGGATSIAGRTSFTAGSPGPTKIKGLRIDLNPLV